MKTSQWRRAVENRCVFSARLKALSDRSGDCSAGGRWFDVAGPLSLLGRNRDVMSWEAAPEETGLEATVEDGQWRCWRDVLRKTIPDTRDGDWKSSVINSRQLCMVDTTVQPLQYCEYCSCSDVTSWIAFCWHDKLRSTTDTYEVWRTRFFICWPSSLELATRWSTSNTNDKQFQTKAQDFLSLILFFIFLLHIDICTALMFLFL